jgi:hypothetical protein
LIGGFNQGRFEESFPEVDWWEHLLQYMFIRVLLVKILCLWDPVLVLNLRNPNHVSQIWLDLIECLEWNMKNWSEWGQLNFILFNLKGHSYQICCHLRREFDQSIRSRLLFHFCSLRFLKNISQYFIPIIQLWEVYQDSSIYLFLKLIRCFKNLQ